MCAPVLRIFVFHRETLQSRDLVANSPRHVIAGMRLVVAMAGRFHLVVSKLECPHKSYQILLLLIRKIQSLNQIEEFHRILQSK